MMERHGFITQAAPTWMPEGFTLSDINAHYSPRQASINAYYTSGDLELTIHIVRLEGLSGAYYERDEDNSGDWAGISSKATVRAYERGGAIHYIMTNYGQTNAVWRNENYECVISGDVTEDEIIRIIDSIYER